MRQNIELRLAKYNYVNRCFEEERERSGDELWDDGYAQCVGRTPGW